MTFAAVAPADDARRNHSHLNPGAARFSSLRLHAEHVHAVQSVDHICDTKQAWVQLLGERMSHSPLCLPASLRQQVTEHKIQQRSVLGGYSLHRALRGEQAGHDLLRRPHDAAGRLVLGLELHPARMASVMHLLTTATMCRDFCPALNVMSGGALFRQPAPGF